MSKSIGLYIHIPFCKSKCPYCDFYSIRTDEKAFDEYTQILINKIDMWSKKVSENISTIYFGGGTPSVLGAERLCNILNEIKNKFNINKNAEITVEVNPDTGKTIDFALMRKAGFNRLSVGMQSDVSDELHALGRIHTADDAKVTVSRAKNAGFNNISLDLMLGIPHQTIESLEKSISFCAECGVTHISSYILKIEENTGFYKIKDKLVLPDEDSTAELYLYAVKRLAQLGYEQYEISNFAKKDFESRHNINYWKCGEYIGIGPSAHSFYNGKRFYYNRSIDDFKSDITVFDCNGGDEEEFVMLSLRLKSGLVFEEYKNKFNHEVPVELINKAKNYAKHNLLEVNEKKICFTSEGYLVSNSIISDLM